LPNSSQRCQKYAMRGRQLRVLCVYKKQAPNITNVMYMRKNEARDVFPLPRTHAVIFNLAEMQKASLASANLPHIMDGPFV
jgi:hypothetical protein